MVDDVDRADVGIGEGRAMRRRGKEVGEASGCADAVAGTL